MDATTAPQTYEQALAANDTVARFCRTQLPRFCPGLDPARAYANAVRLGLTATQLGQMCGRDPLAARLQLGA